MSSKLVRFILIISLLAGLVLLSLSCEFTERYTFDLPVMGTEFQIIIEHSSYDVSSEIAEQIFDEMKRIDAELSIWDPATAMSHLNKRATVGWVKTNPELVFLISEAIRYSRLSRGAFDATAGPIIRLWGFLGKDEKRLPEDKEIAETLKLVGYEKIQLNSEKNRIRFPYEGMEIDLGGIAKGFAVDQAVKIILDSEVSSALVNLGGNISFVGTPRNRHYWTVAVRDPRHRDELLGYLKLSAEYSTWGIASSGQYERYIELEGKKYGHIIDPRTGYPVEDMLGTTIVTKTAMRADALSTATFVSGLEKGKAIITDEADTYGLIIVPEGSDGAVVYISRELSSLFVLEDGITDVRIVEF